MVPNLADKYHALAIFPSRINWQQPPGGGVDAKDDSRVFRRLYCYFGTPDKNKACDRVYRCTLPDRLGVKLCAITASVGRGNRRYPCTERDRLLYDSLLPQPFILCLLQYEAKG